MTIETGALERVAAPVHVDYRYGLFSVVTPSPIEGQGRNGVQWESPTCGAAVGFTTGICADEGTELDPTRVCPISQFDPVTVYVFDQRSPVPTSIEVHEQRANDRLTSGEQLGAELALWDLVAASPDLAGTADSLREGLALVEQALAANYGGLGVIHVSRLAASLLGDDAIHREGAQLRTTLGTPVVAGGGYNDPLADPLVMPTNIVIAGTGPLVLYRGSIDTVSAVDMSINDLSVVASRDYVVGWDCFATTVTVTPDVI